MKPLNVARGFDEHFGGFILPESKLLRECTYGIGNESLLVHPLSLPLLHDDLYFLF